MTVEEERRCEEVAQLLIEGKKGEELADAFRDLDSAREGSPAAWPFVHSQQHQQQQHLHRRLSSVPLPNDDHPAFSGITLPSVPFLPTSRAPSPVSSTSRHLHQAAQYNHLGRRISSSAGAMFPPHDHQSRLWAMPIQARPHSLQRDQSPVREVDTSLFNSTFQLESSLQESPFNVADLIAGLPAAHGPLDPSVGSHYHPIGPLEGLRLHERLGPMDTFPDAMDWRTPASEVDEAYSKAPTPYEYEYEGAPAFTRDDPSLYALSRGEGGSMRTTASPYTPLNGNRPLPSQCDNPCPMNMDDPTQQPPMLYQPKPTTPTATAFSDMFNDVGGEVYGGLSVGDGYSADAAFRTLFEPLGFDAGYGAEGVGGAVGYEYADGMGMVG